MENQLDNPVYAAMITGDFHRSMGTDNVRYFDKEISPFIGFSEKYSAGFAELHDLLPPGRNILYATRNQIEIPGGWSLALHIPGLQFLYMGDKTELNSEEDIIPLNPTHADEMVALAKLTKPGPFDKRTIEFGNYYGIFENGRLAAMTGQRLHPTPYSEISAVCTHPDFLGRGYARKLLNHQAQLILEQGGKPFLHVRADNERAIALYEKNNFRVNGTMNFYFMKRL